MTTRGTVYVSSPNAVLQVASALGLDSATLAAAAGINTDLLRIQGERIPVDQYFTLCQLVSKACERPDLGLLTGRVNYFTGMNLHLYMTTVCRDLKEYLNLVPSTISLRGDLGRVLIQADKQRFRLEWHPLEPGYRLERCLVDEMLSSAAAIVGGICALPVPVLGADLSYPRPACTRSLEQAFGSQLRFDCEVSCLYFPREAVNYPLINLEYELGEEFRALPESLFEQLDDADPFLRDVRSAMRRALPGGELTIDSAARDLGISRRTLQRRLTERGHSFKGLLQALREDLSCRYLDDHRLAVTEIALLLGYSDQASFSNAFKAWRGYSPTEYRNKR